MERALRPNRFDVQPDTPTSEKEYKYWLRTLDNYLAVLPQDNLDKLKILTNHLSPAVFEYISEENTYESALENLKKVYVKPANIVFARHLLSIRKQDQSESLDQYLQALKTLSKDCGFAAVDANTHREQFITNTFINGLQSSDIRQRVLEEHKTTLTEIFDQARTLEIAQRNTESYNNGDTHNEHHLNALAPAIDEQLQLNMVANGQHNRNQSRFQNNNASNNNNNNSGRGGNNNNNYNNNSARGGNNNNNYNNNSGRGNNNNSGRGSNNNFRRRGNNNPGRGGNNQPCTFCGNETQCFPRSNCPASNQNCFACGGRGHLARVCRSRPLDQGQEEIHSASLYIPTLP